MTYKNITTVNVALQNANLTARGFGSPMFISSHRYFPERVRTYGSLEEAAVDLPTSSKAYKALESGFGNSPRPSFIKVGRRDADLTLTVATGATEASLVLSVLDGLDMYTVTANVASMADEDAVATALLAAIDANSDIASSTNIVVTNNTLDITGVAGAKVVVKNLSDTLSDSYTTTESASEVLAAIEAEDNDFYFVTADDHSDTFITEMSTAIEAKEKMYFFSTYQPSTLTAYISGSSSDIGGKIRTSGVNRTKGMFHQLADEVFPELKYVGQNAGFVAGTVSWSNLVFTAPPSTSPTTGLNLSSTEKSYLEARNLAYIENRGSNILRNGRVASGESIDIIRGRDNLVYDMVTSLDRLLTSQAGSKIPYNDQGIAMLEATTTQVLDRYVDRGFIEPNYITNFPRENEVSALDKTNRTYTRGTWNAELTGAIEIVDAIQGILSIDLQ